MLPPPDQVIAKLWLYAECSVAEICEHTNRPQATIYRHLEKMRENFQSELADIA